MKEKGSKAGWGFWLGWVAASAVGMFVGFMMIFLIYGFLESLLGSAVTDDLFEIEWLGNLIIGIMFGIVVGFLQWLVLQGRVSRVGWWILASAAAGFGIFLAFFIGIEESLSFGLFLRFTGVAALGGALTGILQWLVLRGKVSLAGWWVLASSVGWALGMAVSRTISWGPDDVDAIYALVVTGAVMGAVTGAAIIWLLRQPVPEAQLE